MNREYFNEEEKKIIGNIAALLMQNGYFTAFNFIESETPLPDNSIIIHYLQDSKEQIEYLKTKLIQKFSYDEKELSVVPRLTYYILDPKYVKKPRFKDEYKDAKFFDEKFDLVDIEEVIANPSNKVTCSEELDFLIPVESENDIGNLALFIKNIEKIGPEPWLDPAIIIRSKITHMRLEGFIRKHYCSIRKTNAEFYSIIFDDKRKKMLEKYLSCVCNKVSAEQLSFGMNSVMFLRGDINKQLHDYMKRNIKDFKPLSA